MNRFKLATLAGTSICLGMSQAALAAPADPWVGWYAGGNIGYSWGKAETATSVSPSGNAAPNFGTFDFPGGNSNTSSKVNGVIGGIQAGYVGRIAPNWLGGVEADIQWSGQKGSARGGFGGTTTQCTTSDCSFSSLQDVTTKLNWFGTFRARAGAEWNNVWFYGTAGFAYGRVSVSGNHTLLLFDNSGAPDLVGAFSTPFSYSQVKGGWTAGAGIEGIVGSGPWRWKIEYLHIDLGTINGGIFGSGPFIQANTTRFTDEIIRVGFNYKFDESGSANNAMNAFAADLPLKALKARPPAYLGWTGWYAGVNAGYIDTVGRTNTDAAILTTGTAPQNAANIASTATNQFNKGSSGFLGGVQGGYNYQFSPSFVAGVEADIQGSTLRRGLSATNTAVSGNGPSWFATTTVSSRLDYFGTLRGRVGVTPTPNLLLYSTGGLAYGGINSNTQIAFNNTGGAVPGGTSGAFSGVRVGWTAGGGLEWMFSPKWTAKLEYLYYDLGAASYATGGYAADVGPTGFPGFGIASVATRTTTRFEGSIARVGLNYQFGGGPLALRP